MAALKKMTLTHRQVTAEGPAYFAIGGEDALGKRAEVHQVSEAEFLRAAKNALKPLLMEVLREADGAVAKYVTQIELAAGEVQKNRKEMEKVLRDLFKAKIEAIAPTTSEGTATVPASTVTLSPDALS